MTPAKRSRARAHKNIDYESPEKCEFSNLRAGPSGSGRSSNEVTRLVQHAPIARGTTAEADNMTQRRCILTLLGKAPPPPKPMVRGRGTAKRKQHRIQGLSVRVCRRIHADGGAGGGVEQYLRGPRADVGDRCGIKCHWGWG
jgi:hypothetical protein